MLSFLRKIRKSLIESGLARKYLLYAIGEILLVMIGILLALQVNNWNEERKDKQSEIKILKGLEKDIVANIDILTKTLNTHVKCKGATLELLRIFADRSKEFIESEVDILLELSTSPYKFYPQMGFFKSLISSGDVKLIENEEIVRFINSIEDQVNEATELNAKLIDSWDDNLLIRQHEYIRWMNIAKRDSVWFQHNWTTSLFEADYKALFNDPIMENMYMITAYDQTSTVQSEQTLLSSFNSILKIVREEIVH